MSAITTAISRKYARVEPPKSAWPKIFLVLITGYLAMGRAFAYIGFPPAKLFVGEVAIALFLLLRSADVFRKWAAALAEVAPLTEFSVAFVCFMAYGWFELVRGLNLEYPTVLALQGFAFHYYPICFFMGMWAATEDRGILQRTIYVVAWVNAIYGILYIVTLSTFPLVVPGTQDVPLFGQPGGSAMIVLGLLCLEKEIWKIWYLLLLNLFVMLGMQIRAEYLGFLLGSFVLCALTRQIGRFAGGLAALALLLFLGFVTDLRLPGPANRGAELSTREIAGRVVAPFNPELAAEWEPNSREAKTHVATTTWRLRWWQKIWEVNNSSTNTAVLGQGYGYPLAGLVGYGQRDLRTPHNIFFYAFGYGGWLGVAIFGLLQVTLVHTLWRSWQVSGTPFGLVIWVVFTVGAFFMEKFETPFEAIPFYLLAGMAAAPLWSRVSTYANTTRAHLLQTAGR